MGWGRGKALGMEWGRGKALGMGWGRGKAVGLRWVCRLIIINNTGIFSYH